MYRFLRTFAALSAAVSIYLLAVLACLPESEPARPAAENPRERLEQRLAEMRDEHGRIAEDGLLRALEQRRANLAAPTPEGTAGLDPNSWTWLGPGNVGGRCRALYIHPNDPRIMLLGSASGGIWRTQDSGASWHAVNDFLPALGVATLESHPSTPNVIYAGTGEFSGSGPANGAGIFRSLDSGLTWNLLPGTTNPVFFGREVRRIAIDPTDRNTLLATTNVGIQRSTDGGMTWTSVLAEALIDLEWVPLLTGRVLAAGAGAIYYSTDRGQTWTKASGLPTADVGRVEVAVGRRGFLPPAYALVQYTAYTNDTTRVYKSTDGGVSWTLVHVASPVLGQQGMYDNAIWVSPTDNDLVVAGGIHLWRSTNGGSTFEDISGVHDDQHWIVHHPGFDGSSNRTVFVCNDGGIFRTSDITTASQSSGWVALNNDLGVTQFYGGAIGATGRLWGGTQDNGTQRKVSNSSSAFTMSYGADGGECAADPNDWRYMYGEIQFAGIFRSTDGGLSASPINQLLPESGKGNAPFIAPIELDRNDSNRMWVGSFSLWRTNDVKAQLVPWTRISGTGSGSNWVSAIASTPGAPHIVYYGRMGGTIYKSTNANAAVPVWTLSSAGIIPRPILEIVVSSINPSHVYVGLGGYSLNNVYFSSDGGQSWQIISGSGATALPGTPIRALAVHDRNEGWLYAGTEVGVFASTDNGATWTTSNAGPANVAIDEFVLKQDTLWAFTHGRGLYRAHAGVARDPQEPIYRASVSVLSAEGNGDAFAGSMTGDGRFVAFEGRATNLVSGDTNAVADIFVRDRQEGRTIRVSLDSSQVQGNLASSQPSMARDGRYVAFQSSATNLVGGDTNNAGDVFVRDLQDIVTTRESLSSSGQQGDAPSFSPSLSSDGRWLAFTSHASNLVTGDTNGADDVFRRDRVSQRVFRLSLSSNGAQANASSSTTSRSISDDGRSIAFTSHATNLVGGDTNGFSDVFVHAIGLFGSATLRVSVGPGGAQANGSSRNAAISADGRYIAFESTASNLVVGDDNNVSDIFLYDRTLQTTAMVSIPNGRGTANDQSRGAFISRDGFYVAFYSHATNLVSGDNNGKADVFVRDLNRNLTFRVSQTGNKILGNDGSYPTDIGDAGQRVAMWSGASNLVPDDTNGKTDVFVASRFDVSLVFPLARTNSEGSISLDGPLSLSNGRMQQAARDTRRQFTMRMLSFRRDGATPTNTTSNIRTIDLEVSVGAGDIDAMTDKFSDNWIGLPTLAIRRKQFNLPDWRTQPVGLAEFDAHLFLDAPYLHDGQHNLLWEARIRGNSRPGVLHPTDADNGVLSSQSMGTSIGQGCQTANGLYVLGADFTSNGPTSDMRFTVRGAPSQQAVLLLFGAADPNLPLPGLCATLHSDALVSLNVGTTSRTGSLSKNLGLPAWSSTWRNSVLYLQALTVQARAMPTLSQGSKLTLPATDPGPLLRRVVSPDWRFGSGTLSDDGVVFRVDG